MTRAIDWQDEYNKYIMDAPEWKDPELEDPATQKQINLLRKLDVPDEEIPYSKKECRKMISEILDNKSKDEELDDWDRLEAMGLSMEDLY